MKTWKVEFLVTTQEKGDKEFPGGIEVDVERDFTADEVEEGIENTLHCDPRGFKFQFTGVTITEVK